MHIRNNNSNNNNMANSLKSRPSSSSNTTTSAAPPRRPTGPAVSNNSSSAGRAASRPFSSSSSSSFISSFTFRDFLLVLTGFVLGIIWMMVVTTLDHQHQPSSSLNNNNLRCPPPLSSASSSSSSSSSSAAAAVTTTAKKIDILDSLPTGFHPIYSYYGKFDHLSQGIPLKWYLKTSPLHKTDIKGEWFGQHGQDVAIAKFFDFGHGKFFVDLAANDAVWASNTFGLEQNLDWKGICIEPNPIYWQRLAFRNNCHVVGAIIGAKDNQEVEVVLGQTTNAGPYGGIVGEQFDNKKGVAKKNPGAAAGAEPTKRYTVSLETILKTFGAPPIIDYLSLDVEGAESFIMKDFPFDKYQFLTLSVERPKPDLQALLEKHRYKHVMDFRRGDTLWAHESVYEEGKKRVEQYPEEIREHRITKSDFHP